ncbi:hypothetical protein K466DRAFT_607634 [Polyporus arcularius HHB13444]|uniref:Uncharacterized protein n=1 Tax=Polyporus arcularius HHB13444 TaxID=1314778 RepID=A0A5C3NNH5_9APHY|nr:hypothetical protein K466DRAFT_607634 [Polyporus arcularius HHB13444]
MAFAGSLTNPRDNLPLFHPLVDALGEPSQASTDYFAYFSPPPNIEDPPHTTEHRLLGAAALEGAPMLAEEALDVNPNSAVPTRFYYGSASIRARPTLNMLDELDDAAGSQLRRRQQQRAQQQPTSRTTGLWEPRTPGAA